MPTGSCSVIRPWTDSELTAVYIKARGHLMGYRAQISPTPSRASRLVWALAFRTAMMTILGGIGFTASAADDQAQTSLPAANKSEPSQSGEELAEVLVTPPNRSEDLRDIPPSILAISHPTILEAHMPHIRTLSH